MSNMAAHQYGHTDAGEYITPYLATLLYHPDSLLEIAVATLSKQTQLVCLLSGADNREVLLSREHISPKLIIFGDTFTQEDLVAFLDKGFQQIYVIKDSASNTNDSTNDTNDSTNDTNDKRITALHIGGIYEIVPLLDGISTVYLLEHILCAVCPTYISQLDAKEINSKTGNCLIKSITYDNKTPVIALLELQSGIDSFDKISKAVSFGQALSDVYKGLADNYMGSGIFYKIHMGAHSYSSYAIEGPKWFGELIKMIPSCPHITELGADFVIVYSLESHEADGKLYVGWRIFLIPINKNISSERYDELLACCVGGTIITNISAAFTGWVPMADSKILLPFLC
jgi:hypothetical protein